MGKRRSAGSRPIGETIGGILVGFDQQIMRNQPPAQELVQKGAPVRGLAGDDAGDLTIVLPADAVARPAADAGSPTDRPAVVEDRTAGRR